MKLDLFSICFLKPWGGMGVGDGLPFMKKSWINFFYSFSYPKTRLYHTRCIYSKDLYFHPYTDINKHNCLDPGQVRDKRSWCLLLCWGKSHICSFVLSKSHVEILHYCFDQITLIQLARCRSVTHSWYLQCIMIQLRAHFIDNIPKLKSQ